MSLVICLLSLCQNVGMLAVGEVENELIPVNFPVPSDFELLNLCFEMPLEKEIIWIVQHQSNWTKQT